MPTASLLRLLLTGLFAVASGSAQAAECAPLKQMASLDLVLGNDRALVEVLISDKPKRLIVDTGGVFSTVTRQVLEEFDLRPQQGNAALVGVTGARSDQYVRLPSLGLGDATVRSVRFMVHPTDLEAGVAGTLAPDFLKSFDLDFDFGLGKLNLMSPIHCEGKVIYWSPKALAVIPMRLDDSGHISVPVMLDGQKLNAWIDTGAPSTAMNLATAQRLFAIDLASPETELVETIGDSKAYRRRFRSLELEGFVVNAPMIRLLPDLMRDALRPNSGSIEILRRRRGLPDVILGLSTLSQMHVYVAYAERKIYITDRDP